ncbi:MAG TPA: TRAM domain-containing protein [Vicinamibacterales bacterium]|nr:TRAM domain-containing protein [Vicinamibacterales bacterium]
MLHEGQELELTIEKPAAGGRMLARHQGQVVLVRGAIPGERVRAWIEKVEKRLAFAVTREAVAPSPDRRAAEADPLCGGNLYAHIRYERQLQLKAEVAAEALRRIGGVEWSQPIAIAGSPERGYRMRSRCHLSAGRAGFFREGTHQLCDPASTGQLLPESARVLQLAADALARTRLDVSSIELAENIAADQRAMHVSLALDARIDAGALDRVMQALPLRGITAENDAGEWAEAGDPLVADSLTVLAAGRAGSGELWRHPSSFFQGNRFLLPGLVDAVLDLAACDGEVLDLYAGVGVFGTALAAAGHLEITAVEGDRTAGADLRRNAAAFDPRIAVHLSTVEAFLRGRRRVPACVIVDPPRTGLSKDAVAAVAALGPPRIVYVSCDPPTFARDARRCLDAGYRLASLRGFDLFPNTPHVELVAELALGG